MKTGRWRENRGTAGLQTRLRALTRSRLQAGNVTVSGPVRTVGEFGGSGPPSLPDVNRTPGGGHRPSRPQDLL